MASQTDRLTSDRKKSVILILYIYIYICVKMNRQTIIQINRYKDRWTGILIGGWIDNKRWSLTKAMTFVPCETMLSSSFT